ncbi:MAG: acyl-CoA thioesterase [Myxococcota bacterium]
MTSEGRGERRPIEGLLKLLELEPLDRDLFLGDPGPGEGRLFGGLVAAQSVMAAGLTVESGDVHSIHAYFLRPGRHDLPIRFVVDRIRNGRTFTTRRVVAHQSGEAIFSLEASFARPEEGIAHQMVEMPDAPDPEACEDWEKVRSRLFKTAGRLHGSAVEVRMCDPDDFTPKMRASNERRMWMRPSGAMPDDTLVHSAVMAYASDRALLSTAGRPHGLVPGQMRGSSLDHAMHWHRRPHFDDWLLYAADSPVAHSARGLIYGAMYRRDGTRVASVVQEGLIRVPREVGAEEA